MKHILRALTCLGLLVLPVFLAGCITSTIQGREKARNATYSTLSPEFRTLVDQGRIKNGMPQDAVYIAWGQPDQVTEGEDTNGLVTTTWSWYGTYLYQTEYWGWRRVYWGSTPVSYIRASAEFSNGLLKQWHTYPAPGY